MLFLPFKQCERITYQIRSKRTDEEIQEESDAGSIYHIFSGWDSEFCSKSDKYGIDFPGSANEKDKALLIVATIFIDYLWFENF